MTLPTELLELLALHPPSTWSICLLRFVSLGKGRHNATASLCRPVKPNDTGGRSMRSYQRGDQHVCNVGV